MTHYEIVKIKETGQISLPQEYAYDLGMVEDSYFLVEIDTGLKEVRLERVAFPGKKLVELEMIMRERPGVLAMVSAILARYKANIMFNESEELSPREAAFVAVMDVSKLTITVDELREKLSRLSDVKEIVLKPLE